MNSSPPPWPRYHPQPSAPTDVVRDANPRDFHLAEYENLPALIAHWDSHVWSKSNWFFGVQSLLLGAAGIAFKDHLLVETTLPTRRSLGALIILAFFNLWLCYVWFRTNRSNREYLKPLFERARAIETAALGDGQGTFNFQLERLNAIGGKHSSSRWETHLPSGFGIAWAVMLVSVSLGGGAAYIAVALAACLLALILLVWQERLGSPRAS
jgi:hypothetical protein